jgi:hypothetical protein
MMRKGRIVALVAALISLLAAGWWFGSPWWTLWRMREAARAGDSEALAGYIDFPALRASTRAELAPRLGPLGSALAGPAVDALVSPAALRLALGSGRDGGAGGELDLDRTAASEFRLHRDRGDLVFRRHGLGWKLEAIAFRRKR